MPESFDEMFPGGVEECVATLSGEPSIDNPGEVCEWLQENGFESLAEADEAVKDVLLNLTVEYVSVVDTPAQESEWLITKSMGADEDGIDPEDTDPLNHAEFVVRKDIGDEEDEEEDAPERKAWAAVLIPDEVDRQGEMVPEPEIESAAHEYLKNYRKVDSDHNLLDGAGVPVESYIVRNGPDTFELPNGEAREYPEGTWILGMELSEDAWQRVEDGELTGLSIYGGAAHLDPDNLLSENAVAAIKAYRERQQDEENAGDDDEDGEQSDEQQTSKKNMEDENGENGENGEQNEKLDRILKSVEDTEETVTEVQKSVSSVEDRVSELEEEVYKEDDDKDDDDEEEEEKEDEDEDDDEETEKYLTEDEAEEVADKAVEKFVEKTEDDDEDEEVVRKSDKNPGGGGTDTAGGPQIDVTTAGVLGGDD